MDFVFSKYYHVLWSEQWKFVTGIKSRAEVTWDIEDGERITGRMKIVIGFHIDMFDLPWLWVGVSSGAFPDDNGFMIYLSVTLYLHTTLQNKGETVHGMQSK